MHRTQENAVVAIRVYCQDAGGEPDEVVHKVRFGGVPSIGASVPMELRVHLPPGVWLYLPIWNLSEPRCSGVFMEALLCKLD